MNHLVLTFKFFKHMLVVVASLITLLLLILFVVLFVYSPGKPAPFLDQEGNQLNGSISVKTFIQAGGVSQGMIIRSRDTNNPVLLYLHGGPSFPNYFLIDKFKPGLEDYFTVCYWEQRGGGLSYSPAVLPESMNFDQLTSDAIEVANYLRQRFGKDRIYLMAHSGGTPIALLAAARSPQLFAAYIAMAQVTQQAESEKMAYDYMLAQYIEKNDINKVKKFQQYPMQSQQDILSFFTSALRDQSMHALGIGTMHNMTSVFTGVFLPVWTCKAYTPGEKINIWKSKFSFLPKTNLHKEIIETDFTKAVTKLDMPVYFLSGKYDLTVNLDLSRAYLEQLQAPVKGFYTFTSSAHSPLYEEPERLRLIIENDILQGTAGMADTE
ncbi:MAG: alpha/beta hydrolase [Bacteroidales bacterium]|nr:alpha/beta hydrolase [Bacteroidales bacterium]